VVQAGVVRKGLMVLVTLILGAPRQRYQGQMVAILEVVVVEVVQKVVPHVFLEVLVEAVHRG
jgi:hypothetical protein